MARLNCRDEKDVLCLWTTNAFPLKQKHVQDHQDRVLHFIFSERRFRSHFRLEVPLIKR